MKTYFPDWIDAENCEPAMGEIGFLIERSREGGATTWSIASRPAHTNRSGEPKLEGWCGTINNVGVYAHGLARVGATSPNDRTRVELITDADEIAKALETLCYPELIP